ncbi:hypothetical protein NDU88_006482 [Pleurodeles waltl]|uniref:Uncharacterized protein n=1 Tax=Pleurodeles waltl TaxID=8319 RepID=A0AAV7X1P0_PLEWA|nr:hypothetical protein NDU88_006482 [Pleurodeles waltl]
MPPKRSVLCRPPRLLPHSMQLSRRYTDTDRARRTDTERAWSRQYTNTDRAPCSAPSLLRLCLHTSSLSRFPCFPCLEPAILAAGVVTS